MLAAIDPITRAMAFMATAPGGRGLAALDGAWRWPFRPYGNTSFPRSPSLQSDLLRRHNRMALAEEARALYGGVAHRFIPDAPEPRIRRLLSAPSRFVWRSLRRGRRRWELRIPPVRWRSCSSRPTRMGKIDRCPLSIRAGVRPLCRAWARPALGRLVRFFARPANGSFRTGRASGSQAISRRARDRPAAHLSTVGGPGADGADVARERRYAASATNRWRSAQARLVGEGHQSQGPVASP